MSNLDRAKWEKHYEAEDILFIDEEEVLKLLWSVSSEVESWVDSKEENEERNDWFH